MLLFPPAATVLSARKRPEMSEFEHTDDLSTSTATQSSNRGQVESSTLSPPTTTSLVLVIDHGRSFHSTQSADASTRPRPLLRARKPVANDVHQQQTRDKCHTATTSRRFVRLQQAHNRRLESRRAHVATTERTRANPLQEGENLVEAKSVLLSQGTHRSF